MKLATKNLKKLVTATRKGCAGQISLMVKDDVVYSLSLQKRYMYFSHRKNLNEKKSQINIMIGVFEKTPNESATCFFKRLFDEIETEGVELPALPTDLEIALLLAP